MMMSKIVTHNGAEVIKTLGNAAVCYDITL
jgi:hypothetical protein